MDFRLKSCARMNSTLEDVRIFNDSRHGAHIDRLTTLPNELLIRILSLLPTKEAAVMCVLSQRMRRVFSWVTTLDFDASFISHCGRHPNALEQFPSFVTFVNTVLQAHQSPYLTKFRLQAGVDFGTRGLWDCIFDIKECFPDLKYSQINAWISFPLTRCGLKELDLCIQTREPGDAQLPPEIFKCETLEVLKLDVNLGFDRVSTFRLPNLKILHLYPTLIFEDSFLTRLVSSCPVLEDLTVFGYLATPQVSPHLSSISISSPSLKKLRLLIRKLDTYDNTDLVHIDAPNVKYFSYSDNMPRQFSLQNMPSLVEAVIGIPKFFDEHDIEVARKQMFNLIRSLSSAQHMSLLHICTQLLNFAEAKDQLPLFPNLKCLELGHFGETFWDEVLLAFLYQSPFLETLIFPEGLIDEVYHRESLSDEKYLWCSLELEREFCMPPQVTIPQCCRSHLKKIVIKSYFGNERELKLIQFLLRHALVLEELVIFPFKNALIRCAQIVDPILMHNSLEKLQRASATCSIQVIME